MVLFGGPAAVLAQEAASSTSTTTESSTGTGGSTDSASSTDTTDDVSTNNASSSDAVDIGDNGTSSEQTAQTSTSTEAASSTSDGNPAFVDTGNASSSASVVGSTNTGTTNTGTSSLASTTIANDSSLTSSSTATSSAQSGSNSASDTDGASIFTGAADSFGELISLFNIVIVNSVGQLIFLQNPLGSVDLTSQIVGAFSNSDDNATSSCTLISCAVRGLFNVITDNAADITNTLVVRSGTGLNDAESLGGEALVETGDASAFGSIVNIGNLQIIDSRYLVILLNKLGDLVGDIVLPEPDFFASLSASAVVSDLSLSNDNTGDITNNGVTNADSGTNTAQSTEQSIIVTGEANAGTDVHNFVNQNSLGNRPVCFIVSVGGKWDGKVVGLPKNFTQEDTPFGKIICGSGSAQSRVTSGLNASTTNYAKILNNALVEAVSGGNIASGTIAKIKTGNADAFLSILNLVNQNIVGTDWIFALFTISGDWKGDLTFGNKDFWNAVNAQVTSINGGSTALRLGPANVKIEKQVNPTTATASTTVGYAIKVRNTGDPIYHAKLIDTIYDSNHKPVHQQVWELDTVAADEEVSVSYTVNFSASTTPGQYTNEAYIDGYEQNPDIAHNLGRKLKSPVAKATLEIVGSPVKPFIAPAADVCEPYINSYIRYGEANDPTDVTKLQSFLVEHEQAQGITLSGLYDSPTLNALEVFQVKHAAEILTPWGLSEPTGYVYYTTQNKINALMCDGKRVFDYAPGQLEEIEQYRSSLELRRSRGEEIPEAELNEVGAADPETRLAADTETVDEVVEESNALADAQTQVLSQTAAAAIAVQNASTSIFKKIRTMIGSIFAR